MKKKLDMQLVANELKGGSRFFPRQLNTPENEKEVVFERETAQTSEQEVEQPVEQVSKELSSPNVALPNVDVVERLAFDLRKERKGKVNTEIPLAWRRELEEQAHRAGVGKYNLLMYIIGLYLKKVSDHQT